MNMKFQLAVADAEAHAAEQQYHMTVFDLPGKPGEPDHTYAAVRPVEGAFLMVANIAARAQQKTEDHITAVLQFLDHCFVEEDLRAALIESGRYEPLDTDVIQDEDLSDAGVELLRSNKRLYGRLMDRSDPLGSVTLAMVMKDLVEGWSGNPTGSPRDYLPPRSSTGKKSTGRRSSRAASTSPKSSAAPRRGSARRSTPPSPAA